MMGFIVAILDSVQEDLKVLRNDSLKSFSLGVGRSTYLNIEGVRRNDKIFTH